MHIKNYNIETFNNYTKTFNKIFLCFETKHKTLSQFINKLHQNTSQFSSISDLVNHYRFEKEREKMR